MKLEGTLSSNLNAAIASAERLRGHPVHADTVRFWTELLAHARAEVRARPDLEAQAAEPLIAHLQRQLIARERAQ